MDLKKLAEPFKESEIEWRIGQAGKKDGKIWANCLAYVQSRAIMDRLDEVCGPGAWKPHYEFQKGGDGTTPGVLCGLSIRIGDEWVTKYDGAEQTDIESFKGGISSALKRAGSVWGIGRYLYGLEQGFATIVTHGGNYARLPEKAGGDSFRWTPPPLPAWALPKGETAKPPQQKAPDGLPLSPIRIQQPPADGSDGIFTPGSFVIPVGKSAAEGGLKGLKLKDIERSVLIEKLDWIEFQASKPLGRGLEDTLKYGREYIAATGGDPGIELVKRALQATEEDRLSDATGRGR